MIQKNNLFATFKTQEELHEYFRSHTGRGETFLLTLGAALMWNTIAHLQDCLLYTSELPTTSAV